MNVMREYRFIGWSVLCFHILQVLGLFAALPASSTDIFLLLGRKYKKETRTVSELGPS